jgi:hypothetical protein
MTIQLTQNGNTNFIQSGVTTSSNSIADIRITNNSTSGTTFMTITTSGNIGIGTTIPIYSLDVSGAARFTTGITTSNINITGSIYQNGSLFSGSSQWSNGNSGNIFYTLGNVGIGTTSPSTKLDVNGEITCRQGRIYISDVTYSTTGNIIMGHVSGDGAGDFHFFDVQKFIPLISYKRLSTETLCLMQSRGYLGIGTSSPTQILQVGNGGRLRIANSASDYSVIGTVDTDGATNARIVISGRDRGGADTNGNIEYVATGTNGKHIFYTTDSTTSRMTILASGNVGIGTSSPSGPLHIVKSMNYTTPSNDNGHITIISNTTSRLNIGVLNSGDGWLQTVDPGNVYMNLILNSNGGNVGIGTTVPIQKLEVAGAIRISTAPSISYDGDASIIFNQATVGPTIQGYQFDVRTGSATSRLRIDNNGNVGIGTTSPSTGYGGTINNARFAIRSGTVGQSNGTSIFLIGGDNNHYSSITAEHTGGGSTYLSFGTSTGATNPTEKMRIDSSGNVGIGTTSPRQKLDITGSITTDWTDNRFIGMQYIDGAAYRMGMIMTSSTRNLNLVAMSGDGGSITFSTGTNPSERMRISTEGYVGIGTNNPGYPLHVSTFVNRNLAEVDYYWLANTFPNTGYNGSPAAANYSIYATYRMAADEFNAFSDSRIKKDIVDIIDTSALETLRLIEPKQYKYKDEIKKGNQPVWGFIAQQVASVLEYSTGTISEFIPNVFDGASVMITSGKSILTLDNASTSIFTTSGSSDIIKIKMYIDEQNTVKELDVTEVLNENMFVINYVLPNNRVFIYGTKVDDFKTLNKDAIFTVAVAALQEVDRELQNEKLRNNRLESELMSLREFIQNKFPGEI